MKSTIFHDVCIASIGEFFRAWILLKDTLLLSLFSILLVKYKEEKYYNKFLNNDFQIWE